MSRRRKAVEEDAMDLEEEEEDMDEGEEEESSFHEDEDEDEEEEDEDDEGAKALPARKRGRPPGSTNKKVVKEKEEEGEEGGEEREVKKARKNREFPSLPYFEIKFKSPKFVKESVKGRGFRWPGLQRVYENEAFSQQPPNAPPNHLTLSAGRSMKPAGHYCDVTGFPAPYSDPRTHLRYASANVFQYIRSAQFNTEGKANKYLDLRKAGTSLV